MKTTLFVIAAFLFSGAIFAQKTTVNTTQSATVGTNSVNGTASAQTASQADIKSGNAKTGTEGAANVSTGVNTKKGTAIASEGKTTISAATATEHADALKNRVNSTTSATVKSSQHAAATVNSEIKQTAVSTGNTTVKSTQNVAIAANSNVKQATVGTTAAVKSVDAGVKGHAKAVAPSSVKVAGAVHNNLKAPSIKPAVHVGANMKVGLR